MGRTIRNPVESSRMWERTETESAKMKEGSRKIWVAVEEKYISSKFIETEGRSDRVQSSKCQTNSMRTGDTDFTPNHGRRRLYGCCGLTLIEEYMTCMSFVLTQSHLCFWSYCYSIPLHLRSLEQYHRAGCSRESLCLFARWTDLRRAVRICSAGQKCFSWVSFALSIDRLAMSNTICTDVSELMDRCGVHWHCDSECMPSSAQVWHHAC